MTGIQNNLKLAVAGTSCVHYAPSHSTRSGFYFGDCPMKSKEMIGKKFGRLKVLRLAEKDKNGNQKVFCRCSCGKEKVILMYSIHKGITKSCGCLIAETTRKRATIHGHSTLTNTSKTYNAWHAMIQRCSNPKNNNYKRYGGRGIKVCKKWSIFKNFLSDMGAKPKGKTIERIDNDGDYCLENCRWATRYEQDRNRSTNHFLTHDGKTMIISDWSKYLGIKISTIQSRLKYGWSIKRTLTEPVRKGK